MFSDDEKKYLREVLKRELDAFRKDAKVSAPSSAVKFLKAEHDYGHFIERLMEKLK
ncbi:hypothetical protein J4219_00655 [Candidatus Woesearchaeota archaeon]|nr:hypothetical protein [Candidatus Woesearchaeota archaeon]